MINTLTKTHNKNKQPIAISSGPGTTSRSSCRTPWVTDFKSTRLSKEPWGFCGLYRHYEKVVAVPPTTNSLCKQIVLVFSCFHPWLLAMGI